MNHHTRRASITLHLEDNYLHGTVVATNSAAPAIGRTLTPAEGLATELLNICNRKADQMHYAQQGVNGAAQRTFLARLLDMDDLGHAVSAEVRDGARTVLGIAANEGGYSRGIDIDAVHALREGAAL